MRILIVEGVASSNWREFLFLRLANFFIVKSLIVYFKWICNGKSIGFINRQGAKVIDHVVYLESVMNYWKANNVKPKSGWSKIPDGIKWDQNLTVYLTRKKKETVF